MEKCIWCNENGKESLQELKMDLPIRMGYSRTHEKSVIHKECKTDFNNYMKLVDRYSGIFTGMMRVSFVLVVLFLIVTLAFSRFAGLIGFGVLCITLGLMFFYLPFATPQTVKRIGLKKSRYIVRLFSVIIITLGVSIIYLAF